MNSIRRSRLISWVIVVLVAIGFNPTMASADTIHNDAIWTSVVPFGEPGAAYYQQTFVALPGKASELTIFLSSNEATTRFRVLITEVVAGIASNIGPNGELLSPVRSTFVPSNVLFESATITVPFDGSYPLTRDEFTAYTIPLGGLPLKAGSTYAFVLDAASEFTGGRGTAGVAITKGDSYPGGTFSFYDGYLLSGATGDRTAHFQNGYGWGEYNHDNDIAFRLRFAANTASPILPPISRDGTTGFKLGQTIPVKIRVTDSSGAPVHTLVPQVALVKIANAGGNVNVLASSSAADIGSTMRSTGDGNYVFNLSTKRSQFNLGSDLTDGAYRLTITDATFTAVVAEFSLRR
jgi:hypothetical protein